MLVSLVYLAPSVASCSIQKYKLAQARKSGSGGKHKESPATILILVSFDPTVDTNAEGNMLFHSLHSCG